MSLSRAAGVARGCEQNKSPIRQRCETMFLGVVSGEVYSTINHPLYDGYKLLLVDRVEAGGEPTGKYVIAIDKVGAGVGETVLVNDEGNSARQIVEDADAPVRTVIVGIVDEIAERRT